MPEARPRLGPRNFSEAVRHAARAARIPRQEQNSQRKKKHDLERRRLLNYDDSDSGSSESTADSDGLFPPRTGWTHEDPHPPNPHQNLPVYRTILRIRRDVIRSIGEMDTTLLNDHFERKTNCPQMTLTA